MSEIRPSQFPHLINQAKSNVAAAFSALHQAQHAASKFSTSSHDDLAERTRLHHEWCMSHHEYRSAIAEARRMLFMATKAVAADRASALDAKMKRIEYNESMLGATQERITSVEKLIVETSDFQTLIAESDMLTSLIARTKAQASVF